MTAPLGLGDDATLACVEVGGAGVETVLFSSTGDWRALDGAHRPAGATLAVAVPGLIAGDRVIAASNLGWFDVDPVTSLGLQGAAAVVSNDAEAAALGEAVRRDSGRPPDLVHVGLGTGVGGAVVVDGHVVAANLFGHTTGFGSRQCRCGAAGCLETVAAGWALPDLLEEHHVDAAARAIADAVEREPLATARLVVVAGGMARAHPTLLAAIAAQLPGREVEPSAAPPDVKSAAAWGLRQLVAVAAARS
jgi:predicted NBD/HSP70 family sugar kinase